MIESDALYPLVFTPVYKEVMWGGNKLETILNREIPPHSEPVGESWEIVDRDDAVSTVENGPLKGCTLRQLVEYYGKDLVGADTAPFRHDVHPRLQPYPPAVPQMRVPAADELPLVSGKRGNPQSMPYFVVQDADDIGLAAGDGDR